MISRQSVIDVLKERQNFYAERNQDRQFFAIANVIDDVLNLPSENPWHTGTPTEEGYYLCHFQMGDELVDLCLNFKNGWDLGNYNINPYTFEVIAWQKIEPFKEEKQ